MLPLGWAFRDPRWHAYPVIAGVRAGCQRALASSTPRAPWRQRPFALKAAPSPFGKYQPKHRKREQLWRESSHTPAWRTSALSPPFSLGGGGSRGWVSLPSCPLLARSPGQAPVPGVPVGTRVSGCHRRVPTAPFPVGEEPSSCLSARNARARGQSRQAEGPVGARSLSRPCGHSGFSLCRLATRLDILKRGGSLSSAIPAAG